jgi:hypothetical protein
MPLQFGEIDDPYADVTVYPDFVLYDGDICLLVEVKAGNNIEPRDVKQMVRCNELSIDGVEAELDAADVTEKTDYDGTVRTIDSCIVYQDIDEEWIDDCRTEWDNCREQLEALEAETAVLTQDYGGSLRRLTGEFKSNRLQHRFDEGITLPENPKEQFMITEQMEQEVLAITICDIWGERVVDYADPVQTNVNEIRDFFAPPFNIPPQRVNRTLYYLQEIGACDHVEDLTYEFSRDHIREILTIETQVRDERVEETLSDVDDDRIPDEEQATLDMDWDEETAANGGQSSPESESE